MALRSFFYRHPYASMVTIVFLFSSLVTALFFFGVIPGQRTPTSGFARLGLITGILLVVTVAVWLVALTLSADD